MSEDIQHWIERARKGDEGAFQWLYDRYAPRVKAYFLRCGFAGEADDVLQETFLRAFGSLNTYDPGKSAFATWVSTIARNVARKRWRRKNGPAGTLDPELAAEVLLAPDDVSAADREELAALDACVNRLPPGQQKLIRLRYVGAMTTRGMAETLAMPESTVRLRMKEAMSALRSCLREKGIES